MSKCKSNDEVFKFGTPTNFILDSPLPSRMDRHYYVGLSHPRVHTLFVVHEI
jgi:hypothetical protein